jgi:homoserine dehydrogenase
VSLPRTSGKPRTRVDLAILGFGHVGRRFALLLDERADYLTRVEGIDVRVVAISTRRHGSIFSGKGIDLRDAVARRAADQSFGTNGTPADLIAELAASSAPIRVVAEATTLSVTDAQPALAHVEMALDSGCHVVTVNKGPVAFAYRRLNQFASDKELSFLFEGAVMDGIPIFNLVRETLPGVTINGFRGIVNTTTQHILMALEQGEPFSAALERMQAEGIAEADPALDLDGWDAAAKAAALANVLLDGELTPRHIAREGLGPNTLVAVQRALASGRRLRMVVTGARDASGAYAAVRLTELDAGDVLATLPSAANALMLKTDLLDEVAVCQMRGDVTQTAYALFSDLVTVCRRAADGMA